jgi:putative FmdB family regulatory protein
MRRQSKPRILFAKPDDKIKSEGARGNTGMPLYEYRCKKCGHTFERIVPSYLNAEVKECPVCHGEVEQLLSAPAVQFKGSGFYSTDYAKASAKSGQGSGDGAAKAPAGGEGASGPASGSPSASPTASSSDGGSSAKTETTSSKPAAEKSSKRQDH